jgi:hypothetical protein
MVKDMHLLLQSKDPNRKFPITIPSQELPQYFDRLLHEVNSQTAHDFYGKIELGIKQGKWMDLPVPLEDKQPESPSKTAPTVEAPQEETKSEETIEEPAKKKKNIPRRVIHGGGSKPKVDQTKEAAPGQGQVRPTTVIRSLGPGPTRDQVRVPSGLRPT